MTANPKPSFGRLNGFQTIEPSDYWAATVRHCGNEETEIHWSLSEGRPASMAM